MEQLKKPLTEKGYLQRTTYVDQKAFERATKRPSLLKILISADDFDELNNATDDIE